MEGQCMNKVTVHSVKEKSMDSNAIQLNTVTKERTNEEGLMNHRRRKKEKKKRRGKKKKRPRKERERGGNIKACMQLRFKKRKKDYYNISITVLAPLLDLLVL